MTPDQVASLRRLTNDAGQLLKHHVSCHVTEDIAIIHAAGCPHPYFLPLVGLGLPTENAGQLVSVVNHFSAQMSLAPHRCPHDSRRGDHYGEICLKCGEFFPNRTDE